jgi:antitoxin (DNA-binding transcriptional repressor) of toxin-antitoxin stability system
MSSTDAFARFFAQIKTQTRCHLQLARFDKQRSYRSSRVRPPMQVSVTQLDAKFSAIAQHADAGEEVIVTTRGKPAYCLLPIMAEPRRLPFPDVTALAKQSKAYKPAKKAGANNAGPASFVADWRAQYEHV